MPNRFWGALALLAVVIAFLCLAFPAKSATAPDACGDKYDVSEQRAEVFGVSENATIMVLADAQGKAFIDHILSLGMPKPPAFDAVWLVKWNDADNSASVLLFRGGCRIAVANGLPFEKLEPGLGSDVWTPSASSRSTRLSAGCAPTSAWPVTPRNASRRSTSLATKKR